MNRRRFIRHTIGGTLLLFGCYFIGLLTYGWATDWQPGEDPTPLSFDQISANNQLTDSLFTLAIWNVGFGGLGAESDFFYDDEGMWYSGNSMTQSPKHLVEKNLNGALQFFEQTKDSVDFFLLQEADIESDRSYRIRQYDAYQRVLQGFSADFAVNYQCNRVPIPLLEPWNVYGEVLSGLATFSRYHPQKAIRYQLPGHYPMPDRLFQLDRCAALHRYSLQNGKELVIINLHNSAYDPGDKIKAIQMPYLRDLAIEAYENGDYVVLGGDWNQCPPHFRFDSFMPGNTQGFLQGNVPPDFFPEDWVFAYDPTVPSNRKARDPYQKGKTFVTLIDFFLVSPNVRIRSVRGLDQGFQFSDHQPVLVTIELR
ncbi:MAG: endonuclease/exonuclease/phosphatase family protein [Saprospiraceae bacterium]